MLICTTARDRPLMNVWLPSLREKGEYTGDVLIINYDLSPQTVQKLRLEPNTILVDSKCRSHYITNDRFRAFHEAIKDLWYKYDVIMVIDGNDVEFTKPIKPLFELAKREVCYVTEDRINSQWVTSQGLVVYRGPPDSKEVWDAIKNRLIINLGMFIGPAKMIFRVVEHIAKTVLYIDTWGGDQLIFNGIIYYYGVPSKEVDKIWNYDTRQNSITPNVCIIHRI